jgi:Ras-related protein Rab-18
MFFVLRTNHRFLVTFQFNCFVLIFSNFFLAREVTTAEGQAFAREKAMVFIETSAKTTVGIRQTFEELVAKILDNPRLEQDTRPKDKSNIVQQVDATPTDNANAGGCC